MSDLDPGRVIADRYRVIKEIGRGATAIVYEAEHVQLGTRCAIKALSTTSRSVRRRLLLEGRVLAAAAHPNIVSVLDVVEVDATPALVLELMRGPTLQQVLAGPRLTWDQCDAVARDLFAGINAAHTAGLIHRDLKPANILCSVEPGRLIAKVADFGLAKVLDEVGGDIATRTRTGAHLGTPAYMAPEQVRSAGRVDARADVFSLGAILYEMCCGVRPFDGDDLLQIYLAIASGTYASPRTHAPDLPERMEEAIRGALEPDRDKRLPTVQGVAARWFAQESGRSVWGDALQTYLRPSNPPAPGSPSPEAAAPVEAAGAPLTAATLDGPTVEMVAVIRTEAQALRPRMPAEYSTEPNTVPDGLRLAGSFADPEPSFDGSEAQTVLVRPMKPLEPFEIGPDEETRLLPAPLPRAAPGLPARRRRWPWLVAFGGGSGAAAVTLAILTLLGVIGIVPRCTPPTETTTIPGPEHGDRSALPPTDPAPQPPPRPEEPPAAPEPTVVTDSARSAPSPERRPRLPPVPSVAVDDSEEVALPEPAPPLPPTLEFVTDPPGARVMVEGVLACPDTPCFWAGGSERVLEVGRTMGVGIQWPNGHSVVDQMPPLAPGPNVYRATALERSPSLTDAELGRFTASTGAMGCLRGRGVAEARVWLEVKADGHPIGLRVTGQGPEIEGLQACLEPLFTATRFPATPERTQRFDLVIRAQP